MINEYLRVHKERETLDDTNACTVVSVAIVGGISYEQAYQICFNHGRKHGRGMPIPQHLDAIAEVGYDAIPVTLRPNRHLTPTTVGRFYRKGTYLAYTASHVLVVRDGVVHDWTNLSKRPIEQMFELIPDFDLS